MSIPAIIYLCLMAAGVAVAIVKDGEPRSDYSAVAAVISSALILGLLYWGGFFDAR